MENNNDQLPLWEVFIQKSGGPFRHEGSVHASDHKMALQNARDVYTRRGEGRTLWVVPSNSIASTTVNEEGEFFDPADVKIYRHPTFYTIPEGAKNI